MTTKKIILAGCSYTINTWSGGEPLEKPFIFGEFLDQKDNLLIEHIAVSGNSNDASIRQIYEHVKNNNIKDSTIVFQVTHLHRMGGYFNFLNDWVNLQPLILDSKDSNDLESESFMLDNINTHEINDNQVYGTEVDSNRPINGNNVIPNTIPTRYINLPRETDDEFWTDGDSYLRNKVIEYYKLWLQYKYDDFIEFKELLIKIDFLKAYLASFNNKLSLIYWPDIYPKYEEFLKEYNFFKIDGEYSMLRWSKKNNVIGKDTHLTKEGHRILSEKLYEHLGRGGYLLKPRTNT